MRIVSRVPASLLAAGLSACCLGSSADPGQAASTEGPHECFALCERILGCHAEMGARPREADLDCESACAPSGMYGRLTPEDWACSARAECSEVWACTAMATAAAPSAPSTSTPDDWPASFPIVPGGSPIPSPPMGPVHVAVLSYEGRAPAEIAAAYRTALASSGWTIPEGGSAHDEHAERFIAMRGAESVSVSIYREATGTYVQTMQLSALFAP